MKYLIIILLTLSFQLSAQSSMTEKPSGTLTAKETAAYEAKAESKVAEFYSQLEFLTDPKLEAGMKELTEYIIIKLFITNTLTTNIFDPKATNVSVATLLKSAMAQKAKTTFTIENLTIEAISETNTKKEWLMTYTLKKNDSILNVSQLFYIIREDKKFGTTTKKVTNTYLGAITIM